MIHHIDFLVADLTRSRAFYEQALAPLGLRLVIHNRHPGGHEVLGFGALPDPVFWIRNGNSATPRLHIAFHAPSRAAVDAFHRAAVAAGGVCNGAPGLRPRYAENYYAAFVRDPDGNNIEAVCRTPTEAIATPRGDDAPAPVAVRRLRPGDAALYDGMLTLFGRVFEDAPSYDAARPGAAYRDRLLARREFVALVAVRDGDVVGALAGYELIKFEQERSEFYIYDLAVDAHHRRRGVATALIAAFKEIAKAAGGWVVYVQADQGDDPAIALYSKLGTREDVLHFDMTLKD